MEMFLNGAQTDLDGLYNQSELADAVYRSFFSWAPLQNGETTQENVGFWGDCLSDDKTDRYGSRLYLFTRTKINDETCALMAQVCNEALEWIVKDGLADSYDVKVERDLLDKSRINIFTSIFRGDKELLNLQFRDLWHGIL